MAKKRKYKPTDKVFEGIELTGKFVVAYDTMAQGNQTMMHEGEDGISRPCLFDSADEAFKEIFDGNLSMLLSHEEGEQLEEMHDGNITPDMLRTMENLLKAGDVPAMRKFLDENPDCNYNDEFEQTTDAFLFNRRTFFPSGVSGINLVDLTFKDIEDNQ